MSPWVLNSSETFNVDIDIGPLENLDIAQESRCSRVTDVLEHFPDQWQLCALHNLLKPDGFMLIQTPQFKEE